jgi:putative transposase
VGIAHRIRNTAAQQRIGGRCPPYAAIQEDDHFYAAMRYVERNALRADLVAGAEHWRWSSLWTRTFGDQKARARLADGPLPLPVDWLQIVNSPQTEAELQAIRQSVCRGCPFGDATWQKNTAVRLGLAYTLCPRGRPRKC